MQSFRQFIKETKISLEYHDELNPKLWDNDKLKPQIRDKLLNFATTWASYAHIKAELINDIVMTGGNANYNYTPISDIDIHLIVDRSRINPDRELVDNYLQAKKIQWSLTHNIKILGYSIEPYAQDINEKLPVNQGAYSLKNDKWITHPNHENFNWQTDKLLKQKIQFYKKLITHIIKENTGLQAMKDLKKKISDMRSASIAQGGEFSTENLVFKELRNKGFLDRMNKYIKKIEDKQLSL